jgi:hypothetical protein
MMVDDLEMMQFVLLILVYGGSLALKETLSKYFSSSRFVSARIRFGSEE